MIDFHFSPTPNGWKVAILLEELELPYTVVAMNLAGGDQFRPEFEKISPANRMPAILDRDVNGEPVPVFESGAIMLYLAEKTGRFLSSDPLQRKETLEWMFWQVGSQGPMAGQHSHFWNYAPDDQKGGYAAERYRNEYLRCIAVIDRRLEGRSWIAGSEYSIADMICWPWMLIAKAMGVPLDDYPRLAEWRLQVKERPAVQRAVSLGRI